jgi:protease IV
MDVLERDFYEERRRRWRRGAFWRGFFVALLLVLIVSITSIVERIREAGRQVARVDISGIITEDVRLEAMLREIAERDSVQAVILRVNSPGGTTAGSEALYDAVRAIAAEKPVVAVLGEVAASGGYVAAISADHIVSRGNTLTGSIGVIMEYPDVTELLDRWGIDVETFRSSTLKAEPAPYRPISPEGRELNEALVAESFGWFRDLVGARRGLEGAELDRVANGAVFTGRVALEAGLVDTLGGEREALDWLESQREGLGDLPVRTWEVERDEPLVTRFLHAVVPSGGILGEITGRTGPKLYSIAR